MATTPQQCDIDEYFEFALQQVKQAGKVLEEAKDFDIEEKGVTWDLVTEYDRKIEEILIQQIKAKYPTHKFIGEEESAKKGTISKLTDDPTWIIDPIDGTANFVRGFPITCVSVGLTINKEQTIGIIYAPMLNEMYTAIKGRGAFLNGKRIGTSQLDNISKAVFNYEISLAKNPHLWDLYMYRVKHIMQGTMGMRSFGSAALGLCFVANGTMDAYQCDGLEPWDAAAGVLIVREAGGYVCDSSGERLGEEFDLMNPNFLATSTKKLGEQFLRIEKKADMERRSHKISIFS